MSDYLGNLVARSLGPAETALRPRLASRFEPLSPWAPPLALERAAEEPSVSEATGEEAVAPRRPDRPLQPAKPRVSVPEPVEEMPLAPVRARRPRRGAAEEPVTEPAPALQPVAAPRTQRVAPDSMAEQPVPALPRQAQRVVVVEAPEQPSRPAKPVAVRPALPAPAAAVAPPPQTPPARGIVPPVDPPPPALLPRRERREAVRPGIAVPERLQPRKLIESVPRQEVPPPSLPARAERREESPAIRPAPPARVLLEPRVTVVPAPPPVSPVPAQAPEAPAPTIQVTIGRIEVRATPPPAQPSRPRPSGPSALSLEEYLRRRSKGGDG